METLITGNLYKHWRKQDNICLLVEVGRYFVTVHDITYDEKVQIPMVTFAKFFIPLGDNTWIHYLTSALCGLTRNMGLFYSQAWNRALTQALTRSSTHSRFTGLKTISTRMGSLAWAIGTHSLPLSHDALTAMLLSHIMHGQHKCCYRTHDICCFCNKILPVKILYITIKVAIWEP